MEDKIIPLLRLLHCSGLGPVKLKQLLEQFGTPENILNAGWDGKKQLLFGKWKEGDWERDLEAAIRAGVRLLSFTEQEYPQPLLALPDFPPLLYVKGQMIDCGIPRMALIGTRNATIYGMEQAEKIAKEMAASGVCIISGLARGIDSAAHQGALNGGGSTMAIIGSGLLNIYPKENRFLAEQIERNGCVVSELPMHTAPSKGSFPRRNRIVSGLADLLLLAESPVEGGGMITMRMGAAQGKPLFALPGRVDALTFGGNHLLIKENKANLVENSSDLLKQFKISKKLEPALKQKSHLLLSREESSFLEMLPHEEKTIEELVLLTQLPIMQLNILLTRLLLKKLVKEFPGKIYKKVSNTSEN